jgi:ADP-ribose pyrophosphatase YjhB (NUDIX family)
MTAPASLFCGQCGGSLSQRFIPAEQRERRVCDRCGTVAYSNPQVLANTIVAWGDQVLLCLRAGPPAAGRWALPGGFVEAGETLDEAAARETFEETGVQLNARELRLHAIVSLSEISQVYVGFLATVAQPPQLTCGTECSEVRFFTEADLPWSELSYPDIGVYLRMYFQERRTGAHPIHFGSIDTVNVANRAYQVTAVDAAQWQRPRADKKTK